jgi:hypothetical protein
MLTAPPEIKLALTKSTVMTETKPEMAEVPAHIFALQEMGFALGRASFLKAHPF